MGIFLFLFIYFFLAISAATGVLTLNKKYKWFKKEDLSYGEEEVMLFFLGVLLWPLALIILGCIGIAWYIKNYALPE